MRRLPAVLIALLALAACHPHGSEKPAVKDAWVRLAAVPGQPAAGYFTVTGSDKDDRLLSIDSAVVNKIELHEVGMSGGMMTMRQMADVPVPAGATVGFAPSGNHAMMFGVDARITPGTGIPLLFSFKSGAKIEVEAKTIAAGGDAPDGAASGDMDHKHH
ncbi:MAG: copper chaperone PCu(A)C [Sphingomonadales bacterium]|nr:MAG: copper chaperone PCu(A)C [Sphingomonadales bacterium]